MIITSDNSSDQPETLSSDIDQTFWDYFDMTSFSTPNTTCCPETIARDQGLVLSTYGVLLLIGGVGNVAALWSLSRLRRRRSRVDLLMTHLAVADVCVTCGVIPLEIGWKYTNEWVAGNVLCKVLQVMRAFGLYLSSNVLVCISIDRFFALIYPLRLSVALRRSKQMLYYAWAMALACSLPQSFVFRVMHHPRVTDFQQCVSFDAFSSEWQEVAYNVFCMSAMYFVPLVIITVCYVCILCKIRCSSHELNEQYAQEKGDGREQPGLRRSGRRVLERVRRRTLRMTVVIVAVFALCWLPYATMAMWYMIDRKSASDVSPQLQDLLFAMAVSNSCMNPLVYGSYSLNFKGAIRKFVKKTCCRCNAGPEMIGHSGLISTRNIHMNSEEPLCKSNRPRLMVRFAETSVPAAERVQVPKAARAAARGSA